MPRPVPTTRFPTCLVLLAAALTPLSADANQSELDQTPHGATFSCPLCHQDGQFGPENRTPFGAQVDQFDAGGNYDWAQIYALDADNDGATNGAELGDPDGLWTAGDPNPDVTPTNPNDPNSFPNPCGNGVLDDGEECDGPDLAGQDCEGLGFDEGRLACGADCTFNTGGCRNEGDGFCGDGLINGVEACDGDRLLGRTCLTQGFTGGTLVCAEDCTLDTSGCVRDGDPVCGDGVRTGDEQCDGAFVAGESCESLGAGTGTLGCGADCNYDLAGCPEPEVCDDTLDNDGDGGADCGDRDCLGFPGCPVCGDGVAEGVESCDGDDLGAATCAGEGFATGTIACTPTCELDTTACRIGGGSGGGCAQPASLPTLHWRSLLLRR